MNMKTIRPLAAAAALLIAPLAFSASTDTPGEHPAVLVAKTWSSRGIDPNTFIVAHPARLQLVAASPTEEDGAVSRADSGVRVAKASE
jgi:hypothetical protein